MVHLLDCFLKIPTCTVFSNSYDHVEPLIWFNHNLIQPKKNNFFPITQLSMYTVILKEKGVAGWTQTHQILKFVCHMMPPNVVLEPVACSSVIKKAIWKLFENFIIMLYFRILCILIIIWFPSILLCLLIHFLIVFCKNVLITLKLVIGWHSTYF